MINGNILGVYLRVFTKGGIFDIPYDSFEQLDSFTVQFSDKRDLINKVFGDKAYLISDVEIKYVFNNKKEIIEQKAPIKYLDDNFSHVNLKKEYRRYLETHIKEVFLKKWKLKDIIKNSRKKNGEDKDVTPKELGVAIDTFWAKGYKGRRDVYFTLKEMGINVEIVPTLSFDDRQLASADKIKAINSSDNYVNYLQIYSQLDNGLRNFVLEQLSMFDIDELTNMNASVDGTGKKDWLDILFSHMDTLSVNKKRLLMDELVKLRDKIESLSRKRNGRNK